MTDVNPGQPPEITFPLDYNLYSSAVYNMDFKGAGTLTILSEGPTYTFKGKPRGLFKPKSGEMVFHHDDIANVAVTGRCVQFKTKLGTTGKKDRLFAFHLRDKAAAQALVELLPRSLDTEFKENHEFQTKLDSLYVKTDPRLSVTNAIIALNVLVYIAMGLLGAGWFEVESMMPYILYGANNGAATTDGEWWRLLTSAFMHYGILHLLLNMWALYMAGNFVEKLLGRWLYLLAYLGSGIAGSLASIAWHGDQSWSAGASGAIFGVYGVILGYSLRQKQALPKTVFQSLMKSTLTFAGYNILYGFARAGIDNSAHAGGLVGGIAFGWLLALPVDEAVRRRDAGRRMQLGLVASGVLLVAGISLTPRYDYRISDVIAWQEAIQANIGPEMELLKDNEQWLSGRNRTAPTEEYLAWIDGKLMPFYADWRRKLMGLTLTPGKSTIRLRDELVRIFDLRLESYRHLAAALRAHDPEAKLKFVREDAKVVQELTRLQQRDR